jgi:hypothetical protein
MGVDKSEVYLLDCKTDGYLDCDEDMGACVVTACWNDCEPIFPDPHASKTSAVE